jgi:hypothetical protein
MGGPMGRGKIHTYFSKNHRGAKEAPPIWGGLAYLCRKFVIFGGRKSCKSLLDRELRIFGIFEDSKIVQLQFVLFGFKASEIELREKLEARRKRGFWRDLRVFLHGRSACGGQDSDELFGWCFQAQKCCERVER